MNEKIIKDYLLENDDTLILAVQFINKIDKSLKHLDYEYNNKDFFEGLDAYEVAKAISNGDYSFKDDFVRFNSKDNLESITRINFKNMLISNIDIIVRRIIEMKDEFNYFYDNQFIEILKEC